ncbi:hypothetical protein A3D55_03100 [Candidatus Jorgensenbacteria bacterium RIFCSPHIGHO2_02_FULL_45_20]|uniref:tRNA-guanine(15) transglycosylase-like domain-containing protein n=2 Tax=Candidatus Joergenseniibacteriota TaxID=1752739 RepID=A0A1F6BQ50_9BACT|nr:MAG: hypothetical protein UX22_C0001G0047 [Candidatus Jorgensenbacteria bacterium GW2011_GWA2_45_9]OGG38973.1 MAG: hypothetical protein A3D55_03100 [Candidatus Jorgensenbacteria bacterium RIFCSPHIGHO2_02_FULL_45_20]
MFCITHKDSDSRARAGVLETKSGKKLETPAYAIVGTNAEVRCIDAREAERAGTRLIIANTYHLWRELGDSLNSFEGLPARIDMPGSIIMTDSGGFQVFSFGFGREHNTGKVGILRTADFPRAAASQENLVRVTENGAFFTDGRDERFLGPEESMKIQERLGADIMFAFDECTSPWSDYEYTKKAMNRTHRWAEVCLSKKTNASQMLYGIVQGGVFSDLRAESAKFIGSLPFDGFGIGGSFGENGMGGMVAAVNDLLPEQKPRHLLGIGTVRDVFKGVDAGVDTFDCVVPTREARHGALWTRDGRIDLKKSGYVNSTEPLEMECSCEACSSRISRGELRKMFKLKDRRAGKLATIHNVFFFNNLMCKIRKAIKEGKYKEFKSEFLGIISRYGIV